jgi:hypothetical protein
MAQYVIWRQAIESVASGSSYQNLEVDHWHVHINTAMLISLLQVVFDVKP